MSVSEPLPNSEDLQSLVDRFGRAKWITGLNLVRPDPDPCRLDFTDVGRTRMKQIVTFLDGANRTNFPDDSDFKATAEGEAIVGQLEEVLEDLMPPRLSSTERQMLFGLALVFSRQQP